MHLLIRYSALIALGYSLVFAGGIYTANAASDGTLGATSTGRSNITITVTRELRINNLGDISLGTFDVATAPFVGTDTLCVYDNGSTAYQMTLSSLNGSGIFEMINGANRITYTVEYDDTGTGASYSSATEAVALVAQANATSTNDSCVTAGSDNATVRVTVTAANVSNAANGTYTDTLSAVIAPTP